MLLDDGESALQLVDEHGGRHKRNAEAGRLPMIPIYVTYFAAGEEVRTSIVLRNALGFVLGFACVAARCRKAFLALCWWA
mgnify:CR=1 FL=1